MEAALQAPQVTEGEYQELHTQDPAKVSLNALIRVHCYGLTQHLKRERDSLRGQVEDYQRALLEAQATVQGMLTEDDEELDPGVVIVLAVIT